MTDKELKDGEPCDHPGCLSHVSHPCEGCGRVAGKKVTKDIYFKDPLPEDTLSKDPGLTDSGE